MLAALLVPALLICLHDPWLGMRTCILIGILQDPLRKLVPGTPVYVTLLVGVFAAAVCVGARARGVILSFRPLHRWKGNLVAPFSAFVLWVVFESVRSYGRTGSAALAGLGLVVYLSPALTILLGYHLTRSDADLRRTLRFYVVLATIAVLTVYLNYLGVSSVLLKPVGLGLYAYAPGYAGTLDLMNGIFRGSEIAGWHGAAATCFFLILLTTKKSGRLTVASLPTLVIVLLFGAILLTGRRKYMVEILAFACIYGALLYRSKSVGARYFIALGSMLALGFLAVIYLLPASMLERMTPYYARGMQVQSEMGGRVSGLTTGAFGYIYYENGFLGSGAGSGSQGAQYFGGGANLIGSSAEGGLGKVLAELGVPGIMILLWIGFAVTQYLYAVVRETETTDQNRAKYAYGFAAFLLVNGMVFAVAHQIFGDLFVLLLLGWTFGTFTALPKLNRQERTRGRLAANPIVPSLEPSLPAVQLPPRTGPMLPGRRAPSR